MVNTIAETAIGALAGFEGLVVKQTVTQVAAVATGNNPGYIPQEKLQKDIAVSMIGGAGGGFAGGAIGTHIHGALKEEVETAVTVAIGVSIGAAAEKVGSRMTGLVEVTGTSTIQSLEPSTEGEYQSSEYLPATTGVASDYYTKESYSPYDYQWSASYAWSWEEYYW